MYRSQTFQSRAQLIVCVVRHEKIDGQAFLLKALANLTIIDHLA